MTSLVVLLAVVLGANPMPGPVDLKGRGVTALSLSVLASGNQSKAVLSCKVSSRRFVGAKRVLLKTYGKAIAFTATGFKITLDGPALDAKLPLNLSWAVSGGTLDSLDFGRAGKGGGLSASLRVKRRLAYTDLQATGWKAVPHSNAEVRQYEKRIASGRVVLAIIESPMGPRNPTIFRIVDVIFRFSPITGK